MQRQDVKAAEEGPFQRRCKVGKICQVVYVENRKNSTYCLGRAGATQRGEGEREERS